MGKIDINTLNFQSIRFYENGSEVSSRFDIENDKSIRYVQSSESELSLSLYSLISSLIIYKAQGKIASSKALEYYRQYFLSISGDDSLSPLLNNEKNKALNAISAFFEGREKVLLANFLAYFFPLVLVKVSTDNGVIDKKIFQSLNKKKEVIFNQASLYIRSLYHGLLASDVKPDLFKLDNQHLDKPYFIYDHTYFIPTDRDAFNEKAFKQVIEDAMDDCSLSLKDCNSIAVLYLLRAYVAAISF